MKCTMLDRAWASNSINTTIFRSHGVFTIGRFQFAAYYLSAVALRVTQIDLASGARYSFDIPGEYNLFDAHNSISLACDRDGHLHLSYDHHATYLRYRRSIVPLSVLAWTDELPMSGQHESRVTYPTFLMSPDNLPLLMLYRDGVYNRGTARLKEYQEATQRWVDRSPALLSGEGQRPWTSNAYWNHPAIARDGTIHLSFVWRSESLESDGRINNVNIDYAKSPDHGHAWYTSRNRKYRLPITQVNSETVYPVSPGSNLINQCSMAVDSAGQPHIVFYSDDPAGVPQYQHLWLDGGAWRHNYISRRSEPFVLSGAGTLQVPISRPEIVIDADNHVYVIYRGDLTNDRMVAQRLLPPFYEFDPNDVRILWDESVGYAEPVIDRLRWRRDGVLSMLIQKNRQPPHDQPVEPQLEPIFVVDWALRLLWNNTVGSH